MAEDFDIEASLSDVADETGFPLDRVDRIFELINEVDKHGGVLKVINGEVFVEGHDNLPVSLQAKLNNSEYDIVELLDPVMRACRITWE